PVPAYAAGSREQPDGIKSARRESSAPCRVCESLALSAKRLTCSSCQALPFRLSGRPALNSLRSCPQIQLILPATSTDKANEEAFWPTRPAPRVFQGEDHEENAAAAAGTRGRAGPVSEWTGRLSDL